MVFVFSPTIIKYHVTKKRHHSRVYIGCAILVFPTRFGTKLRTAKPGPILQSITLAKLLLQFSAFVRVTGKRSHSCAAEYLKMWNIIRCRSPLHKNYSKSYRPKYFGRWLYISSFSQERLLNPNENIGISGENHPENRETGDALTALS